MSKVKRILSLAFPVMIVSLGLIFPMDALSQTEPPQPPPAILVVDPASATAPTCSTIDVAIGVAEVQNLTAFDLLIHFDNTVLEIVDVVEGGFLASPTEPLLYSPENNDDTWNTDGFIRFGMAQQRVGDNDPAPVSGDGDLIVITLQALLPNVTTAISIDESSELVWWGQIPWDETSPVDGALIPYTKNDGTVTTDNCVPTAYPQTLSTYINTPLAITLTGFDPDGDPLEYLIQTNPSNGVLSGDPPNLTYTPNLDYVGTDSFTFLVSDGLDNSTAATITINVKDVPVALPDYYDLPVNGSLTVTAPGVLGNDMGPAGETLVATLVGTAPVGLVFDEDGSFTYTPPADFEGEVTFSYMACYDSVCSDPVTVTLAVKQIPVAVADAYQMAMDTTLSEPAPGVLGNDTAGAGATLTAELVTDVDFGALTLNLDGSFSYEPTSGWTGTATFEYRACDGSVCSDAVSVTIEVKVKPTAVADSYQTPKNVTLNVPVTGVLGNDTGAGSLHAELVDDVTVGTLTLNSDGSFMYVPQTNMLGTVTFTYQACDGEVCSDPATVTITVKDVPVAVADSYDMPAGGTLSVVAPGVLGNDLKPVGVTTLTAVLEGTAPVGLSFNSDGSFTYTPDPTFTGPVTFSYRACYDGICSDPVLVTIEVKPLPTALDDEYQVAKNTTLSVPAPGVLSNDTKPVGVTTLTAVVETDIDEGTLALLSSGSLIYIPPADFVGTKTFTYRACYDGDICSAPATVTIYVKEVPVAVADDYEMPVDGTLTVPAPGVLGNDTGTNLTAALVGTAPTGLTFNPDGSFSYTPSAGFSGTTTFSYQACDGTICSEPVTVTIEVKVKPTAVADSYQTAKNATLNIAAPGVLGNDTGTGLTAELVTDVTAGTLTLNSDGSFEYIPVTDALGPVTFTYKACDGLVCSDPATVTITVKDTPATNDDDYWTFVDEVLTEPAPGVLGNDTAPNSEPLHAVLVDDVPASEGILAFESDGSFVFTPASGFVGTTTFTYRACYNGICSVPATVTIQVLETTCLQVDPESLEQSLYPDETADQTLTVINTCDYEVPFELLETTSPLTAPLLLDEGFEGGSSFPTDWLRSSKGATLNTWTIKDALVDNPDHIDEGQYAAWITYDVANASDEWLLTPSMDVSAATDMTLSFRAWSSTLYPGATMKVWVTDAAGDPLTDEPLWDLIRDEDWADPGYRSVFVDLSAFDGYDAGEIRIAWQYVGQNGQSFGLDEVQVGGRSEVTWLSQNPTGATLPASGTTDITVTFDSTGLVEGNYFAAIFVQSEPYPTVQVPVILHVLGEGFEYYIPLFRR